MMTILLAALDQTIVSVAVPTIARQLGGFEWMAWVISGYLIASTVVTPLYGRLSDLVGRRRVMTIAILVFLLASVGCALAQTLPQLVLARVLQGAGGGGLIATAQSVVADVVPLRERGRYQGYISGVFAVASVAGPVVGGVFTHYLSWRWIFWINLPLGLAAFLVSRRALAGMPVPGIRRRIDYVGAGLLIVGLTTLLLPITRLGQGVPWGDPGNLAMFAVAVVVLAICLWHEARTAEPIIPIHLFRLPIVAACCGIVFLCFFQLVSLSSLSPMRFQMVAGVAADDAAWRLLPLTFMIPLGAFLSGRIMLSTGRHRPQQVLGTALVPFGLLGLAFTSPTHAMLTDLLMMWVGLSIGIVMPSSLVAIQNAVPRSQLGVATAGSAFFRTLGGAIGVAVLSAVLLGTMRHDQRAHDALLPVVGEAAAAASHGRPLFFEGITPEEADHAFRRVLLIAAGVSTIAFLLSLRVPDKHLGNPGG